MPKKTKKCGECGADTSTSGYNHDGVDVECGVCAMPLCDRCVETMLQQRRKGHDPEGTPPAEWEEP